MSMGSAAATTRSITSLLDPSTGPADVHVVLTARTQTVTTTSGRVLQAWTFNGQSPGPALRVRAGQLLEVVLRNENITAGVTIHWHGLDVPAAMDGVAGVTQNAVWPGQSFTYRFRPTQVGTFWYHSHQDSDEEVGRGLYGTLVVLPAQSAAAGVDLTLPAHTWSGTLPPVTHVDQTTIGLNAGRTVDRVAAGSTVRLRLINTDNRPQHWTLAGSTYRVLALDGVDLHGPQPLSARILTVPAGGRMDLGLTMPDRPVLLGILDGNRPAVLLTPDGRTDRAPALTDQAPAFDPLSYGTPASTPFSASSVFDVTLSQVLRTHHGTKNGLPVQWWTINGQRAPNMAMQMVSQGQLVRIHIVNSSDTIHPMHLHGHHVLVLFFDGRAPTGSPWWADTIELNPGDDVVIGFRADNPGIWMDHCHNLDHAAAGMMLHLAYAGVTTPFAIGQDGNDPE